MTTTNTKHYVNATATHKTISTFLTPVSQSLSHVDHFHHLDPPTANQLLVQLLHPEKCPVM